MPPEVRFLAFWMIAVGCNLIRWSIFVGARELPQSYYLANGARMFDFALDAVVGAIALTVGLWFYVPSGGSITKPGTTVRITTSDVASCMFICFFALALILWLQISFTPYELQGFRRDLLTVVVPDTFAMFALAFAVVRLT